MCRVLFILLVPALGNARTQAHLPLQPGLPQVPEGPLTGMYAGDAPINYASNVLLGGSRQAVVSAATHDVDAVSEPFHEWDVNHASGPSVLDCPDGFALTADHTCVFLEFRRPQESCPYGTFRDRTGAACVQVDSVPPDRTCPAGFEYFMRGCIRKTQSPPLLTCPAGYSQLENLCYSVSSVPPQLRCPQGTSLVTTSVDDPHVPPLVRCQYEVVSKPEYQCPPDSRLITEPSAGGLVKAASNDLSHWSLSPDVPRCLASQELAPVASCANGFSLVSAAQFDPQNPPDDIEHLGSSFERLDELMCAKILDHRGDLTCELGSTLVWPHVQDPAQIAAIQADPYRGIRCRPIILTKETPKYGKETQRHLESQPGAFFFERNNETQTYPKTITMLNENIEMYSDHGSVSVSTETHPSSKRRRPGRGLGAVEFPSFITASEHDYLLPQGQYPKVQFAKSFCQQQDLHSMKWIDPPALPMFRGDAVYTNSDLSSALNELLRATDNLLRSSSKDRALFTSIHSVPICREVQTIPPKLNCPGNARVKCVQDEYTIHQEEVVDEEDATGDADRRRLAASNTLKRQPRIKAIRTEVEVKTAEMRAIESKLSERISDDRPRSLHSIDDHGFVLANQEEIAIRSCIDHHAGRAVCLMTETLSPATPFCPSSDQVLTLRPMKGLETNGLKTIAGSTNYQVAVCQIRADQEPDLECPFGVGNVGNDSGRCDVLLAQPLSASCPEGFTKTTHELPNAMMENYKKAFGQKKGGPLITPNIPDPNPGAAGVCELIEYADYQVTCPHGYRREKAKNTAAACVAEKHIPPSVICPPGFLPTGEEGADALSLSNARACVKQVVVAPTVISYPHEQTPPVNAEVIGGALATACVLTKEKRLSCGVERKYHGMTEMARQKLFGEQFKSKMDRKGKLHVDKYAAPVV